MTVRTTAGAFEKTNDKYFSELRDNFFFTDGEAPLGHDRGVISKSTSLPLWVSTSVSPVSVERGVRERFAWLQIQATKDVQDLKNSLHKFLAGKTSSGFSRVRLGQRERLDNFLV